MVELFLQEVIYLSGTIVLASNVYLKICEVYDFLEVLFPNSHIGFSFSLRSISPTSIPK